MAWHNKPTIGKRRQDYLDNMFYTISHENDQVNLLDSNCQSVEFNSIMSKLIRAWSIDDTYNSNEDYKFEYLSRHSPLLIAKSGFGGIAHELYTSNRPIFYIHGLGLSADFKPIAIVSHSNQKYHIDLSPLFKNLSPNKRKRILKYNKVDKTFSDAVYQFVAKVINSTMVTKF
jgi:hypothetical protein